MENWGNDIASKIVGTIMTFILAGAAWFKSHTEVNDVKADREKTKNERDTKIALLEQKIEMLEKQREDDAARFEKRLAEGSERFDRMDAELKAMNGNLIKIITKVDTIIRINMGNHAPEKEPL